MRILYFTRDYTPHDHRFLTSLANAGHEVFFLRLERRGRQVEDRSLPPSVTQVAWRGGRRPFRWRDAPALVAGLRGVVRQVRPDVIQAGPIQTVAFLAALAGFAPLVTTSWGSDLLIDADSSRWNRWLTTYTLRRSTILVGDCDAVRKKALSFGVPKDRIYTFPWGIDLARFHPQGDGRTEPRLDLRARLGWQGCFVALSLRSWEPVYGVDVVVRGFARAVAQATDLRLLLLGGGSLAPKIHQLIQQNGLGDAVFLGGQVPQNELPRIYRAADLYISASHSDGSSVSLMEALGSGLPALVSDIPGNREWIQPGEAGWLFPDGDDQALSVGILNAFRRTTEIDEMRVRARLLAERRADWNQNFTVLLQAFEAAIGQKT